MAESSRDFAIIFEDDISSIAVHCVNCVAFPPQKMASPNRPPLHPPPQANFDTQLVRLLTSLPPSWEICFLGYHESSGVLLDATKTPSVIEARGQLGWDGVAGMGFDGMDGIG